MKKIYIDPITFECHTSQDETETRIPFETDFFDGKCDTFIEGYRVVPEGYVWTREDGMEFPGEMIAPRKPFHELDAAQRQYEKQLLDECLEALRVMGVSGV